MHVWCRPPQTFSNFPEVRRLCLLCDGQHTHAPWDHPNSSPLSAYPLEMCKSLSYAIGDRLLAAGCCPAPAAVTLSRAAQVATYKQPKGGRVPPLVPQKAGVIVLRGQGCFMPPTGVLKKFTTLAPEVISLPSVRGLPCGSKCQVCVVRGLGH